MTNVFLKYDSQKPNTIIKIEGYTLNEDSYLTKYKNKPIENWIINLIPDIINQINETEFELKFSGEKKDYQDILKCCNYYNKCGYEGETVNIEIEYIKNIKNVEKLNGIIKKIKQYDEFKSIDVSNDNISIAADIRDSIENKKLFKNIGREIKENIKEKKEAEIYIFKMNEENEFLNMKKNKIIITHERKQESINIIKNTLKVITDEVENYKNTKIKEMKGTEFEVDSKDYDKIEGELREYFKDYDKFIKSSLEELIKINNLDKFKYQYIIYKLPNINKIITSYQYYKGIMVGNIYKKKYFICGEALIKNIIEPFKLSIDRNIKDFEINIFESIKKELKRLEDSLKDIETYIKNNNNKKEDLLQKINEINKNVEELENKREFLKQAKSELDNILGY